MASEFDYINNNSNINNQNNANRKPDDINAFFDDDATSGFKFKDLVYLIARNLPWFVLFSTIGALIAFIR